MTRWLWLTLLAALPCWVQAQAEGPAVWRCGIDGRSFSDQPCAGGRLVDVPAPRSAAEVATAQAQAEQEKRLAERLVRERQQRDNVAPGTGLMGIKQPKVVQTSSAPTRLTNKTKVKRTKHRQRHAVASLPAASAWYLASSCAGVSTCDGFTGMQLTGQTCTHCGSSKWPMHSVHLWGSIS
jgi:hypothetical protein